MTNNQNHFPRELSEQEKELLFSALPENKIGYKSYREKIERMVVLGHGRFGGGNFILGQLDSAIDLESSSKPIFAISKIVYDDHEIYVTIHHEDDDQIEIDIQNIELAPKISEMKEKYRWTYSNWVPGQKAPHDNSDVREIHLILKSLVLVIAPEHRKVWVYNGKDEVNYIIPVYKFFIMSLCFWLRKKIPRWLLIQTGYLLIFPIMTMKNLGRHFFFITNTGTGLILIILCSVRKWCKEKNLL